MKWLQMIVLMLLAAPALAQNSGKVDYPFYLLPGEQLQAPRNADTLWIFDQTTYKNAIKKALKLELSDSLVVLLEVKSGKLDEVIKEKDSIIALSHKGYIHYRDLWQKTDQELEQAEIKAAQRWRFAFWGFVVGATIATTTGFAAKAIFD
ncbi:MAG: hypothetical protein ACE5IY_19625 [bacterium]